MEINNIWEDLVIWLRRNLATQIRSVEKNQETEPS